MKNARKEQKEKHKITYSNTINTTCFTERIQHYSVRTQPSRCASRTELSIRYMKAPISNDTIDSVLRHREAGRAKALSAPSRITELYDRPNRPENLEVELEEEVDAEEKL
jgi:hypothetical protein